MELEFVQCLSNPHYINWLAQSELIKDPTFRAYLKYLQYWQRPEYAQHLIYPQALFFLDLLQSEAFQNELARTAVKDMVHAQQVFFWKHYRTHRLEAAARRVGNKLQEGQQE
ncbi:hypothetical protein WJX72_007298 [[Myrmecia] bisecta]|uniref:Mediator of RNA polymerase II transcription subunit 31 n=1 Tax=[Myrmecia] bisecta TaxID=41462 RepID=A0AAW1PHG5_9CHLO